MSDYTPNTEEIRDQYTREQPPKIWTLGERLEAFERWHTAELAAAWDEGHKACHDDYQRDAGPLLTPNPYRDEEGERDEQ